MWYCYQGCLMQVPLAEEKMNKGYFSKGSKQNTKPVLTAIGDSAMNHVDPVIPSWLFYKGVHTHKGGCTKLTPQHVSHFLTVVPPL